MKTSLYTAAVLVGLYSTGVAAVTFSGGTGDDPVVMTLTADLRLPVIYTGSGTDFAIVLEDAYSTNPGFNWTVPSSSYGSPGSITAAFEMGNGDVIEFESYASSGTLTAEYARIDPNDLVLFFRLATLIPLVDGDDTLVLRAGSVTFGSGLPVPDGAATSIMGVNFSGVDLTAILPIPEPSVAVLSLLGIIPLLRRRRD